MEGTEALAVANGSSWFKWPIYEPLLWATECSPNLSAIASNTTAQLRASWCCECELETGIIPAERETKPLVNQRVFSSFQWGRNFTMKMWIFNTTELFFLKNILVKKHVSCHKVRLDPGIIVQSAFNVPNPCNYLTSSCSLTLLLWCDIKETGLKTRRNFLLSSNGR